MRYPRHVVAGTSPKTLLRIAEDGVNLAVWKRSLPPPVSHFLSVASLHPRYFICDAREVREALLFNCPSLRHAEGGLWLAEDVELLAQLLLSIRSAPKVRIDVRLGKWSMHGWHNDYTHVRALAAYRGPGTEWVSNRYVRRLTGCQGKVYVAERGSVPVHAPVHRIATGHAAFIAGANWTKAVRPLAHRQPAVIGPERLLVVIDPDPE